MDGLHEATGDAALLGAMAAGGCHKVVIGIESADGGGSRALAEIFW